MMKWFRCDSDLPHHYSIQRVLTSLGVEGFGGLVLLWCFAANWGRDATSPGRCVDSDGDPIPKDALVAASRLTPEQFDELIAILLDTKGVDRAAWENSTELNFLGMRSRSDEYRKKVVRSKAKVKAKPKTSHEPDNSGFFAQQLVEVWNATVTSPLKPVDQITPLRRRLMTQALKKHTMDTLVAGVKALEASTFCRGGGDRGWVADFNWLLEGTHCEKILDGRYDNGPQTLTVADQNRRELEAFANRGQLTPDA
jgi:hypothetical protein